MTRHDHPYSSSPGAVPSPADWSEPLPPVTLVLGPPGSGRRAYARTLVETRERVLLIAADTGEPGNLARAVAAAARADRPVLVDDLAAWADALLRGGRDAAAEGLRLADALTGLGGSVVLVSGTPGAEARARDSAALEVLNRALAARATRIVFMVASVPFVVKEDGREQVTL